MPGLTIVGPETVPPILPDASGSRVQVWRDNEGAIAAYGYTVAARHWMYLPDVATFCFGTEPDDVTAIAAPGAAVDGIRDAYRRAVMPLMLQTRGVEAIHASAVVTGGGVVAFCGASRTGKSTLAYGLSRRGYPLWADDVVALEALDRGARALPLPFGIRLRPDAAAFFGADEMAAGRLPNDDGLDGAEPTRLAGLCMLTRAAAGGNGATSEIGRLSPSRALAGLLRNAYCFSLDDPGRKRRMLECYLSVAGRVPVFEITFLPSLDRLPAILDAIERALCDQ